ncbi:Mad3/BUB1 homology region 1-domain-containing protein [Pilaira anomala]|nr:Mad3/BUB1 homology region 1-domain-containing protein [Pilaira anomala]
MTPEERKALKDSIPEASIVDAHKEDIEPRREGLGMSSLARALLMDAAERERTMVEGKARFKEKRGIYMFFESWCYPQLKLKRRNTLQVFIDQIIWMKKTFPEGSMNNDYIMLLDDVTSRYKSEKLYRQDLRYLKLWIEYAQFITNPEDLFELLFQHGIGTELAPLYEEYASLLETLGRYDDAFRIYELGIESEVHPVRRLVRSYEESKKSPAERQRQGLLKQKEEDEARRRMYEMRANNRTLLGEKTDARSKTSFSANVFPNVQSNLRLLSTSGPSSFGNDKSSIPATGNSSSSASTSKISVYQDAESSSSSSTSSRRT